MRKTKKLQAIFLVLALAAFACVTSPPSEPPTIAFPTPDLTATAALENIILVTATDLPAPTPLPATDTPEPATTTAVPDPSPTGPSRQAGQFTAFYLSLPPTLDGNLDEWTLAPLNVNNVVYGAGSFGGPDDISATVMIGWNETYLFLGLRVRDNLYVQNAFGNQIFRGDSFEVLLDKSLAADFDDDRLGPDDYQLGMTLGNAPDSGQPRNYLWYPQAIEGPRDQVILLGHSTPEGYEAETAIPWSIFDISPQPSTYFGFAFSVSDNDMPADNVQEVMVSLAPTRRLTDPTTWGTLLLAAP
jgi:hypothetical protein